MNNYKVGDRVWWVDGKYIIDDIIPYAVNDIIVKCNKGFVWYVNKSLLKPILKVKNGVIV